MRKGWTENVQAMLKRRAQQGFRVVLIIWEHKVLAILKEGTQTSSTLEKGGGCRKFYPVLRGGGEQNNVLDPLFSNFVAPVPVIKTGP